MILFIESFLHGIPLKYFFLSGYFLELGNFFTHFISIITFRKGKFYHTSHTLCFWISRILGLLSGAFSIYELFFIQEIYNFYSYLMIILYILLSSLNIYWMLRMIRNRKSVGN